jgi:hypothetical protein
MLLFSEGGGVPVRVRPRRSIGEFVSGNCVKWRRFQERMEKATLNLLGTHLLIQGILVVLTREWPPLEMAVRVLHWPTALAALFNGVHWVLQRIQARREMKSFTGDDDV